MISGQIYAGPGAASWHESATAWRNLAQEVNHFIAQHEAIIANVKSEWQGKSADAMTAASDAISAWTQQTAAILEATAEQQELVAELFDWVRFAVVPPANIMANRTLLQHLIMTNILGINLPQIMEVEMEYAQMWVTDQIVMQTYTARAAAAVASVPQFSPLNIFLPGTDQNTSGLAGLLNLLSGSTNSSFGTFINSPIYTNSLIGSSIFTPGNTIGPFLGLLAGQQLGTLSADSMVPYANTPTCPSPISPIDIFPPLASQSVAAKLGVGSPLGRLTTPPSWAKPVQQPATVKVDNNISQEIPATELLALPLPLPMGTGSSARSRPLPQYGITPVIMPRQPY